MDRRVKIGDPVRTATVPLDGRHDEPMRMSADCDLELVVGTESGWGDSVSWRLTCPQNRCSGTQLFFVCRPAVHSEVACPVGDAVRAEGLSRLAGDDPAVISRPRKLHRSIPGSTYRAVHGLFYPPLRDAARHAVTRAVTGHAGSVSAPISRACR